MEADLQIDERRSIPGEELWFTASRAGGPGGQHVNTSSTRVTLRWSLDTSSVLDDALRAKLKLRLGGRVNLEGEFSVSADGERSQMANREAARERMAALIRGALVEQKKRRPTRPHPRLPGAPGGREEETRGGETRAPQR